MTTLFFAVNAASDNQIVHEGIIDTEKRMLMDFMSSTAINTRYGIS